MILTGVGLSVPLWGRIDNMTVKLSVVMVLIKISKIILRYLAGSAKPEQGNRQDAPLL